MTKKGDARPHTAGSLMVKRDLCDFCGTCVAVCPVDCIELKETDIFIDLEACTMCMNCVKACPLHIILELEAAL